MFELFDRREFPRREFPRREFPRIHLEKMLFYLLVGIPLVLSLPYEENIRETQYIHTITEGPYKNYSGQPLVNLGDGTYYFETNIKSDWYSAKAFCRSLGLFLVSVETAEENELIKKHIREVTGTMNFWTSGNDYGTPNQYVWESTGKPVLFFDWAPNEPNDAGGAEYVIHYYPSLLWNDSIPSKLCFAICEKL